MDPYWSDLTTLLGRCSYLPKNILVASHKAIPARGVAVVFCDQHGVCYTCADKQNGSLALAAQFRSEAVTSGTMVAGWPQER
jgi:hypothetical protein